jgi:hypothetical protein
MVKQIKSRRTQKRKVFIRVPIVGTANSIDIFDYHIGSQVVLSNMATHKDAINSHLIRYGHISRSRHLGCFIFYGTPIDALLVHINFMREVCILIETFKPLMLLY